jgi:hypothetical protein
MEKTMAQAKSSDVGVFELLGRSFQDIRKHKIAALVIFVTMSIGLPFLFYTANADPRSNFLFVAAGGFAWLRVLSPRKTSPRGLTLAVKFLRYVLNWFVIALFLGLPGLAAGALWVAGAAVAKAMSVSHPLIVAVIAAPFALAAVCFGTLVATRFVLVFPSIAFGDKATMRMAWQQSKGWFWKLFGGSLLIAFVAVASMGLIGISFDINSVSSQRASIATLPHNFVGKNLILLLFANAFGNFAYLIWHGFIANAYMSITSSQVTANATNAKSALIAEALATIVIGLLVIGAFFGHAPSSSNGMSTADTQITDEDKQKAQQQYIDAAQKGDVEAQYELGLAYVEGDKGVKQDKAEGAKWVRKAAEQGLGEAQYNLGVMYLEGSGVTQSDTEAIAWWTKAAEKGDVNAQYNLGHIYLVGKGNIQPNVQEAKKWLQKAADQGDDEAKEAFKNIGDGK